MKRLIIILLTTSCCWGTWVSPTSHDPNSEIFWDNCDLAYDGDDLTFATTSLLGPLDLFFTPPVEYDRWFIWVGGSMDFEFWLLYDGNWHQQWTAAENSIDVPITVSAARIVPHDYLWVREVSLREVPEPATIFLLGVGMLCIKLKKYG